MGSLVLWFGKNMGFGLTRYIILAKIFFVPLSFVKQGLGITSAQPVAKVIVQQTFFMKKCLINQKTLCRCFSVAMVCDRHWTIIFKHWW